MHLLGYGSILQRQSRQRNVAFAGDPIPVRVRGYRRGWNLRGPGVGFACTFLGVTRDDASSINAVLVPVEEAEIPGLDRRESGYNRATVDRAEIELLIDSDAERLADSEVFVYETITAQQAAPTHPIIQSYVDICVEGCLETDRLLGTGDEFTREFLRTTHGWSEHWVNDRVFPRAPFRQAPEAGRIDRLLQERAPAEFAKIRIE